MSKGNDYESKNFSLKIQQTDKKTQILMQLHINSVNTIDYPKTYDFLNKNLPSVLRTQCFNDKKLKFKEEVKQTELGHLFEHIFLDQLCIQKLSMGSKNAVFSGRTDWNWREDPRGMFHIFINVGSKQNEVFEKALEKTIFFTEKLLSTRAITPVASLKPRFTQNKTSTDNMTVIPVEVSLKL